MPPRRMCKSSSNGLPLGSHVAPSWSVANRSPRRLNAIPTGKRIPVATIVRLRRSGATRRIVPLALQVVVGLAVVVDQVGVRVIGRAKSEINRAVGPECDAHGIDARGDLLPALGDDDLLVGPVVAVGINNQ